ncbi:hypothetical protein KFE25_005906 [Diacronema lutheri]|uniref:Secreted protein n=1 Tax=Diacronema lutheri TaxID=2081491 RepID=A0A8J5XI65_DIALT|nr:hypothetical protein KFE25_005906 [Diacronema lutheri]
MCRLLCLPCELVGVCVSAITDCACVICACIEGCVVAVFRFLCLPCKCMVDCVYGRRMVGGPVLLAAEYRV